MPCIYVAKANPGFVFVFCEYMNDPTNFQLVRYFWSGTFCRAEGFGYMWLGKYGLYGLYGLYVGGEINIILVKSQSSLKKKKTTQKQM